MIDYYLRMNKFTPQLLTPITCWLITFVWLQAVPTANALWMYEKGQLPIYNRGQELSQPLDRKQVDGDLFLALRCLGANRGKDPESSLIIKKHYDLIKNYAFDLSDEFKQREADAKFYDVVGPSIDSAESVRFLIQPVGTMGNRKIEPYDFENKWFLVRHLNMNSPLAEDGGWVSDSTARGLDLALPISEEKAAQWREENGYILEVLEIKQISPLTWLSAHVDPVKYKFVSKKSGVIHEVPFENVTRFTPQGKRLPTAEEKRLAEAMEKSQSPERSDKSSLLLVGVMAVVGGAILLAGIVFVVGRRKG